MRLCPLLSPAMKVCGSQVPGIHALELNLCFREVAPEVRRTSEKDVRNLQGLSAVCTELVRLPHQVGFDRLRADEARVTSLVDPECIVVHRDDTGARGTSKQNGNGGEEDPNDSHERMITGDETKALVTPERESRARTRPPAHSEATRDSRSAGGGATNSRRRPSRRL